MSSLTPATIAAALNARWAATPLATQMDAYNAATKAYPALKLRFKVPPGHLRNTLKGSPEVPVWVVWRAYGLPGTGELLVIWQTDTGPRAFAEKAPDVPAQLPAAVQLFRAHEPFVTADLKATAAAGAAAGVQ